MFMRALREGDLGSSALTSRRVYVHECSENSGAAAHLVKFAETFGERYGNLVERKRRVVFGDESEALRTLLDRHGATYCRPFGPFPYWG